MPPVALTAPIAGPQTTQLINIRSTHDFETGLYIIIADVDAGAPIRLVTTWAAFLVAVSAASGTPHQRAYAAALSLLGLAGTVT